MYWRYKLTGWKIALVAQDGQEDLPIPWEGIDAIFIGGTTKWKLSESAKQICQAARAMSKWIHAGRINTPARFEYFEALGADSIDGTGLSRYSWMRERLHKEAQQGSLYARHEKMEKDATPMCKAEIHHGKDSKPMLDV